MPVKADLVNTTRGSNFRVMLKRDGEFFGVAIRAGETISVTADSLDDSSQLQTFVRRGGIRIEKVQNLSESSAKRLRKD